MKSLKKVKKPFGFIIMCFLFFSCQDSPKKVNILLSHKQIPLPVSWRPWFTKPVQQTISDTIGFKNGAIIKIYAHILRSGSDTTFIDEVKINLIQKIENSNLSAGLDSIPLNMSSGKKITIQISGWVTENYSSFGSHSLLTKSFNIRSDSGISKTN